MLKKSLGFILTVSLVFTMFAVPAMAATSLQNEADRKIKVNGQSDDGTFPDNPIIQGISPTTGLPFDGRYMPMLVQIDNYSGGVGNVKPWGIAQADIIYEATIQAPGMTRLSALFNDSVPESAGPIRSARVTHADIRAEWDAGFLYHGGQEVEGTDINEIFRASGAGTKGLLFRGTAGSRPWTQYYQRLSLDVAWEHTVDANVLAIQGLIDESFSAPARGFLFTDELPTAGTPATSIIINQKSKNYSSSFTYDSATNTYARFVTEKPFIDSATGEQLTFSNLIIRRTKLSFYEGYASRPMTEDIGSGNADIFIGGRYIAGYWVREDLNSRTVYFDQDGNELKLQRGKTFISILDPSNEVTFE